MSDLGFDPRPYCMRLAKACPDRFTEATVTVLTSRSAYENVWHIVDATRPNLPVGLNLDWTLWAFFGPLADERKVDLDWAADFHAGLDYLVEAIDPAPLGLGPVAPESERTILESIIAAVVESFESEVTP